MAPEAYTLSSYNHHHHHRFRDSKNDLNAEAERRGANHTGMVLWDGSFPLVRSFYTELSATVMIYFRFFVVSSYDSRNYSRKDVPSYLHLLFKPDCMDLVWRFLWTWFSIRRPKYTSEECSTLGNIHRTRPLITPYRILVCTTVTSVGMSKAMLGYYGFSTDVTWTDWALGVPMTTG